MHPDYQFPTREILNIHPEHIKGKTLYIPVAKTKPRLIPLTKKALSVLKNATLPFNIDRHLLGKRFRRLCKHYRIKNLHFHDIRKNSLTDFMKDKGLNVPETMLIAGHKDPRMLLKIYNNIIFPFSIMIPFSKKMKNLSKMKILTKYLV